MSEPQHRVWSTEERRWVYPDEPDPAEVDRLTEVLWAHFENDQSGMYVDRDHEGGELLDGVVDMRKVARAILEAVATP
jgi:hypothetical protein